MKKSLILLSLALLAVAALAVTEVFYSESFGTIGETTDSVVNWENNNNFDVDSATYTASSTILIDGVTTWPLSTGYTGATGSACVRIDATGNTQFLIEGIDSSAYTNITLSLGHYKRSENSSTQLLIHVSDDGQNWTQLTYARPSGTGTNVWQLINPAGFIPSTSNLRIRFSKGANSWWFRIDDVKLTGDRDENVPVALSSFTAAITNQNFVKLSWTTQSEINVAGYYLYRSTNNELSDALVVSPLIPAQNNPTQTTYSFTDSEIYSHGTYYYWLQNVDLDGTDAYHGPVTVYYNAHNEYYQPEIPQKTELLAAFPNPFNPQVSIPFSLADASIVNIRVFNSRGQLQKTFDLGFKGAGNYTVTWNGTDLDGQPASSGVYYIIMNTGQDTMTRKAVLLK